MRIAICDDEEKENKNLYNLIYDYFDGCGLDLDVVSFTSGKDLLNEDKFDLYFLDYVMPTMNGREVALELKRRFNDSVTICYLTSYERAAVELINANVNAVGFLTKPAKKEELAKLFDKLQKNSFFNNIVLKKDQTVFIFHPQDILYIEAMKKKSVIHTFDEEVEFRIGFAELEKNCLPQNLFAKVHRSYIVNLSSVKAYNKKEITLKNGGIIPISRGYDFETVIDRFNFRKFSN